MDFNNLESKTNDQLTYVLEYCSDSDIRNKAWEKLTENSPSNDQLTYVLLHCFDSDIRNKAWEKLTENSPSNDQLTYVLEYCSDSDIRNKAGEKLTENSPSNNQLTYVLRYCSDSDIRNKAGEKLKRNVGLTIEVDEHVEMKRIANVVLANPACLEMSGWHCGTTHCIAGWECELNPDAKVIESMFTTQIAGAVFLPSYVPLFYKSNKEALEELEKIANS